MAHLYDTPGLLYDSGVLYDEPAQPQTRKKMAKVKLGLQSLNPDGTVSLANTIKTAMTANVATFAAPVPTMTALGTLITTASTKIAAYNTAKATAETALAERDAAVDALRAGLTQEGAYVDNVANGDAAKIELAGMAVRAAGAPITLTQVLELVLSEGDFEGTLDYVHRPVNGAKGYEVQTSVDPVTPTSWAYKMGAGKSSGTISGLTSGARIWARIRAIGADNAVGPWSDPAVKTVP